MQRILPKPITDSLIQKDSRLAHLYGLPKTHKKKLAVCLILSASGAYNYKLAKFLDEKLTPFSVNDHTVNDIFSFADDLHGMKIDEHDILVLYDVSSLFTNVPVDETIKILAEKAFKDDWLNKEYDLNITKNDLIELLSVHFRLQQLYFVQVNIPYTVLLLRVLARKKDNDNDKELSSSSSLPFQKYNQS